MQNKVVERTTIILEVLYDPKSLTTSEVGFDPDKVTGRREALRSELGRDHE